MTKNDIALSVSEAARLSFLLEAMHCCVESEQTRSDIGKLQQILNALTEEFPSEFVRVEAVQ